VGDFENFSHIASLFDADTFYLLDFLGPFSDSDEIEAWDQFAVATRQVTQTGDQEIFSIGLLCHADFPKLEIPGLSGFSLEWGLKEAGIVSAIATFGEGVKLELPDVRLNLTFPSNILALASNRKVGTSISSVIDIGFSESGISIAGSGTTDVPESYLFDTDLKIAIAGLRASPAGSSNLFEADAATVTLPDTWMRDDNGQAIAITGSSLAVGHRGLSGVFGLAADAAVTGELFGFDFKLTSFDLQITENSLSRASLLADIQIVPQSLGKELWVSVEVVFGPGGISVALPEDPGQLLRSLNVDGLFDFTIDGISLLESTIAAAETLPDWAFKLSGSIKPQFSGIEWPKLRVDGIGLSPKRGLYIPGGSSISLEEPYSIDWYIGSLRISELTIGSPEGNPDDIELTLSAEVALMEALPAGVSVSGLVATWHRNSGGVEVRLDGIGIKYALPGGFSADFSISYQSNPPRFLGQGTLDLESLDIRLDVVVEVGRDNGTTYLFVSAECDVFPGGIPIGGTGLCLYGISGMLVVNKELDTSDTSDDRYYKLFKKPNIGLTDPNKWRAKEGAGAIGLGAVIGTADDGTIFHAKGMLLVTLPELNIFMQAQSDILTKRKGLLDGDAGPLRALMSYFPDKQVINFDIDAEWSEEPIFSVAGSAHAHFEFANPGNFYLELGREPVSEQISAKLFKMGDWLFTGGFWQRIDKTGVKTGVSATYDKRISAGSFWAAVHAAVKADMGVYWHPAQWETTASVNGYAGLGIAGLSLSVAINANIELTMPAPQTFLLHAKACITFGFIKTWTICLSYTFGGQDNKPPTLNEPFLRALAEPRRWTPPREKIGALVDDGIARLTDDSIPEIWPHSCITLDFIKSVGSEQQFSSHATIPEQYVGKQSGYRASYRLRNVSLKDQDDPPSSPVLFGTWSMSPAARFRDTPFDTIEPRPPNSSLQLLSSDRFGRRGSISGGGAEGIGVDYCDFNPEVGLVRHCVSLAGMTIGEGLLRNGWNYRWGYESGPVEFWRSNLWGVAYPPSDDIQIYVPASASNFSIRFADFNGREPGATTEQAILADGGYILLPDWRRHTVVTELCYDAPPISEADRVGEVTHLGSAGVEEWNIDPGTNLFRPHHTYELSFTTERVLNGAVQASKNHSFKFRAKAAPEYPGALDGAIVGVRPGDGASPFFYGYDITIDFKDNFVPHIYRASDRPLALRFQRDDGTFVTDTDGSPLWRNWLRGKLNLDKIEKWWRETYLEDQAASCVVSDIVHDDFETALSPAGLGAKLDTGSHYRAQLVAGADNVSATLMFEWSFVTSKHATFTDMMAEIAIGSPEYLAHLPPEPDFQSLARACGLPGVRHTVDVKVTPVRAGTRLTAILLEAPEPMSDSTGRLTVSLGDFNDVMHEAAILPNADFTRIFIVPAEGQGWPAGLNLTYKWKWQRKPGEDTSFWRSIDANYDTEEKSATWDFEQWAG
jgi:hypothetical protein